MAEVAVNPVAVVAIIGDQLRHRYVLRRLERDSSVEIRGVVRETKRPQPTDADPRLDAVLAKHFAARASAERAAFGDLAGW